MKVSLIAVNAKFSHSNPAVYSLRNYVEKAGHDSTIVEFSINDKLRNIVCSLKELESDVYIFSVYIWNREIIIDIAKDLKVLKPNAIFIFGGPEVSHNQDNIFPILPQDSIIISGSGEKAIHELALSSFISNGHLIKTENYPFREINFPYRKDDFPRFKNRYLYYESSRGCPFKCSYCLSSRSDQKLELRNIEDVKKELTLINDHYTGTVKFVDRTFNASKIHSRAIWKFIAGIKTKSIFHFEIFPDILEEEDFQLLKTTPENLFQFEIGIQTTNIETLEKINRKSDPQKAEINIKRLLKETKIHIHLDLIAGLPGEYIQNIADTFNYIFNLHPHHFQPGFLKILPGTKMFEDASSYKIKFSAKPPYQVYSTSTLSFDNLTHLENIEELVENIYNKSFFKISRSILLNNQITPFEHYSLFAKYLSKNNENISGRNNEYICRIITEFFTHHKAENLKILTDALRYEWASQSKSVKYPEYLNSESTKLLEKMSLKFLKENYDSLNVSSKFHRKETGKIMFYKAETPFMINICDEVTQIFIKRNASISRETLS